MASMVHQTTHKVEERISELNNKSTEIFKSTETETQREQIMRGKKKNRTSKSYSQYQII